MHLKLARFSSAGSSGLWLFKPLYLKHAFLLLLPLLLTLALFLRVPRKVFTPLHQIQHWGRDLTVPSAILCTNTHMRHTTMHQKTPKTMRRGVDRETVDLLPLKYLLLPVLLEKMNVKRQEKIGNFCSFTIWYRIFCFYFSYLISLV